MKRIIILSLLLVTLTGCGVNTEGLASVKDSYDRAVHDPYPYTGRSMMFHNIPVHDMYVEYEESKEKNNTSFNCYEVNDDNYKHTFCAGS